MFGDRGYLTLFKVRGMPVRLHWTFALGMAFIGGIRFVPGIWLGYFALIALHELGHGLLARGYGFPVRSLDVHGLGGLCSYGGSPTPYQRAVIAWGGVLAQLVLFGVTQVVVSSLGSPRGAFRAQLVYVFTDINLFIAVVNLIPFGGLDGVRAWQLPGLWRKRHAQGRAEDLAAGLREKLERREPGPFKGNGSAEDAPVVRIERAPDGSVRVVPVETKPGSRPPDP